MNKKRGNGPVLYLVCRSGPEWNDPVEIWPTKIQADIAAAQYELAKDDTNIFEKLSTYVVHTTPLKGHS